MSKTNLLTVVVAALFASVSFAQSSPGQAPAAPAAAAGPSDAQIAQIVVTADKIDVDAGKLAKHKSKNKEVKDFAQRMITDHTAVNKKATALAKKLHVTPEASDTSKALEDGAKENMANLKKLKGDAFNKAYVDHEVAYHQQVLDAINKVLIPNAKNPELKSLLEQTSPAIAAHLEHAKKIQAQMASAK